MHIANWYPNPWDPVEGNFVKAQVELFSQVTDARVVNVQVRSDPRHWLAFRRARLEAGAEGFYILTRLQAGKIVELLSSLLLLAVLFRERAWRCDVLHVHIGYPLLIHAHLWKRLFRRPILVSEHWSAYHYHFYLPEGSPKLNGVRRIFRQGFPIITVSESLLDDIRSFAGYLGTDAPTYVIPNVMQVERMAALADHREQPTLPTLFTVNRWRAIKNPMPMLEGLADAARAGHAFELVIGGEGPLLDEMKGYVARSALCDRVEFLGQMTKLDIEEQLGKAQAYLFNSNYETFSVACAEAVLAGVPLVGPAIPAVLEYAPVEGHVVVSMPTADGWAEAVGRFIDRYKRPSNDGGFDPVAISASVRRRFGPHAILKAYCKALHAGLHASESRRAQA